MPKVLLRKKKPKILSKGEEAFVLHCMAEGRGKFYQREYQFHPLRKWRFDFYFPAQRIAIEVEGGYGGRHQSMTGFKADCEKYNAAAKMGITVLRYTTDMVLRGDAITDVLEILK